MKQIIKKELYKQKPIATKQGIESFEYVTYKTQLEDGSIVIFSIPNKEVTDSFTDEMPSQLLIRWITRVTF